MKDTEKVRGIRQNIGNAARLSMQNLHDDPEFFMLQILRKFGTRSALNGALRLYTQRGKRPVTVAMAALLREDKDALRATIKDWLEHGALSDGTAARLANTAIAASLWEEAALVIDRVKSVRGAAARSAARLHWSLGRIDEAIATLEKGGRGGGRQLAHYRSERDTFEGLLPMLEDKTRCWDIHGEPHVLYVATNSLPYTSSGYTQRTHSLLKALQAQGVRVSAATRLGYPVNVGNMMAGPRQEVDGVTYRRLLPAKQRFDVTGRIQQQTLLLAGLVEELQPTILHTTTDFTNALAVRAVAKAYSLPWVYEVRGQLADTWASTRPKSAGSSRRYKLFRKREGENAKAATAVVTLGEAMRKNLMEAGVAPERIQVLPNGVGGMFLNEPMDRTRARQEVNLDPALSYVGTISSLVHYEGLELLVRLVARMKDTHPHLRLLVVGDGIEREPLIELSKKLGIAHKCIFTGRVPRERAHVYHAALDVFMVPRRDLAVTRDVTPLKPVEAMACGVPVMASDLPALSELISHGKTGVLVPAEELEAWVETLSELLANSDRRLEIGAAAREFVLQERTWERSSAVLKQIYWSKRTRS
ncbi:glycosyltransferase family 4 protein [Paeniglutamicibacter sp. Y32M11]|uniref:glycosyltransferase family 4 protein n=1 Tax=Paeniglutamicibacter sp. Y32M11 TaxID=2853258 RepID=UPI001C5338AF|nr:glycosyltransferase family 4 protein [Paeniglutamicibacter sp. Y32M11]QXQ08988.1 glycosyltransferase family 4 protein [Paeniglutamicibacter sp. Y32M11]